MALGYADHCFIFVTIVDYFLVVFTIPTVQFTWNGYDVRIFAVLCICVISREWQVH